MDAFTFYLLVLRIVHIVGGALWVGCATFLLIFVRPTVQGIGPAGPKFMQDLIEKRRFPLFMNVSSALTILAGGLLYWSTSGGFEVTWLRSGPGIGFTLGALVALVVYGIGFLMIRPRAATMGALGREIGMVGGKPTAEQGAKMHRLDEEMGKIERVDVLLLMVSLILMATARYWTF
jgi:hypothetical protein